MPYIPYPAHRYHRTEEFRVVHNAEQDAALRAEGWSDTPATFLESPLVELADDLIRDESPETLPFDLPPEKKPRRSKK